LQSYKPLFDAGILAINPQMRSYCEACWKRHIIEQRNIARGIRKIEPGVISDLCKNIKFIIDNDRSILIKGAESYVAMETFSLVKFPKELSAYTKSLPHTLTKNEVLKSKIWQAVVMPAIQDLILQKISMMSIGASYLTNRGIDSDIINRFNYTNTKDVQSGDELVNYLAHELPFIRNSSLDKLIRFRTDHSEAFQTYRDSIRDSLKDITIKDHTEIKNIVDEQINPEIHKLDRLFKTHQDEFKTKVRQKILIDTLVLSAGIFADKMFGIDIPTFISSTGGLLSLKGIVRDAMKINEETDQIQNNNLYFLWKLKQSSK